MNAHRAIGQPFEQARSLFALGVTRRRAKQKASARDALKEAREIFDRLGAVLWSDRARSEAARISGRATESKDGLTPTEHSVADLVASGRTNRQIAGELFLSVKAVESNVARILHKMQVRNRTELTAKLLSERESHPRRPSPG